MTMYQMHTFSFVGWWDECGKGWVRQWSWPVWQTFPSFVRHDQGNVVIIQNNWPDLLWFSSMPDHAHVPSQKHIHISLSSSYSCSQPLRFLFYFCMCTSLILCLIIFIYTAYIYRVSQEKCARLRESVPYVKQYRYNPKHLYPKLNGYGDNGQRILKLW